MSGNMSGQAIYEAFVNTDMRGLTDGVRATMSISDRYLVRTATLERLAAAMGRAWQGRAADAARHGAGPLTTGHLTMLPHINNAAISMERQMQAFESAKMSVVPVPPVPDKPGFFDNMFSLGNASKDYERQLTAAQSANENNIAVMTQYENATRQNATLLTVPEPFNPELPSPPPSPPPGPPVPPGGGKNPAAPPGSGSKPSSGGVSPGGATPVSGAQFPSDSSAADRVQTRAEFASTTPSGLSLSDTGSPRPAPTPLPDGSKPSLPVGPVGYGSGADPTRGGVPGGSRGTGGGTRMPGGGAGEPGARGGGMGARGAASMESAVGRGAAGRAGAPSGSGPAGGRRKDEEDLEHQRPAFLVEADPDELFGNDKPAAPPVIGG